ncbi:MAG: hypothetical protein OHK0046_42740 [Anaerolineae bacterium]
MLDNQAMTNQEQSTPATIGDRYQVITQLGAGGMGAVYRAKDRLTGDTVALKRVIVPGEALQFASMGDSVDFRRALAQEFKVLATLRHPHIISVLDYGFDRDRQPYYTMELLHKPQTIAEYAQNRPLEEQTRCIIQMLQALSYLHRRGIIHRDLKPDNVLVVNDQVKVLDFGLAAARDHLEKEEEGETVGTIAYMAPEIIQALPASETSDLYAVGIIAFEIFGGRHPFSIDNIGRLIQDIMMTPPPVWDLDIAPELAEIIEQLLEKDPSNRYADAEEVINAFSNAIGVEVRETATIRESFLQAATFVGRDEEFARLTHALKSINDATPPQGSSWLIGGESGVGKSRLLDEIRTSGLVQGALVLRGQGVEGGGLPYQIWRDVMRRLVISVEVTDQEAGILKEIVPDIADLLGRPVADAPVLAGFAGQQRLSLTIADLFMRYPHPVMLMLEDLHWAEESLVPLKQLNLIVNKLPVMLIGSYRNDEKPNLDQDLPGMQVMNLNRLSLQGIEALSYSMLGDAGREPEVVELLNKETEGNIFFIVEVVRALAEEAGSLSDIGRITLPERVFTGGVRQIVRRRLERIPETMRELLKVAAVIGRRLDERVLEAVMRMGVATLPADTSLEDWLLVCSDAAVLDVLDNQWRFAHDKLRETLLADLSEAERPRLHRAVAQAIEASYPDDDMQALRLVEHWHQAGDVEKEADYALIAARQLNNISSWHDAMHIARRAVDGEPRMEQRLKLLLVIASDYTNFGDFPQARAYYDQALALAEAHNEPAARADALRGIGTVLAYQGERDEAQTYFEQALTLWQSLEDTSGLTTVHSNLGLLAYFRGDLEKAAYHTSESIRYAELNNDQSLRARNLQTLGLITTARGNRDDAQKYYDESLIVFRRIGDRQRIASSLNNQGWLAEHRGEYALAERYYDESVSIFRQIGDLQQVANSMTNLAFVEITLNDTSEMYAHFHEALSIAQRLDLTTNLLEIIVGFARLRLHDGDSPGAAELLGFATSHPAANPDVETRAEVLRADLTAALDGETLAAAIGRGQAMEMSAVVNGLLREYEL